MAIKQTVTCDLTDKELCYNEQALMSMITVVYKDVQKLKDKDIIAGQETYQVHICKEKAPIFMEELKKLLEKLKD